MARKTKAKETITAVEIGAEVVEKVVQEVVSNNPESTDFSKIDEAIKTLVEPHTVVSPSEAKIQKDGEEIIVDVNNYDFPESDIPLTAEDAPYQVKVELDCHSEVIAEVLEEKATVVLPEGENSSSEATDSLELIPNDVGLEVVTESPQEDIKINLKHTDLNSLVKDILYIASLGGEIPFGNYTNLRKFPYQADMVLPYAAKEAWENRPEETSHEKSYTVNLSYLDANIFANKLVELGKKGAKLDGGVLTTGMMQAKLKMYIPVAEEKPNLTVGLDKFRYSREELHMLDYVALKALGSWYGVKVGSKAGLIKAILDKQAGIKWE